MAWDKEKVVKLAIVFVLTLAALAVMSFVAQLIQTVLPFLIVGAGAYAAWRWALSEAPAPTADEVEEQARGIFSRFRRTKQAVETSMKVGEALQDLGGKSESSAPRQAAVQDETDEEVEAPKASLADEKRHRRRRPLAEAPSLNSGQTPQARSPEPARETETEADKAARIGEVKRALQSDPKGKIEFKDRDVLIKADDVLEPDISRLEEKEKEAPKVTNNVLAQIEERRRRLGGAD